MMKYTLYQLVDENARFIYYVTTEGTVVRRNKKTNEETNCCTFIQTKSCGSRLKYAKFNFKTYNLATLVYRSFKRGYDSKIHYIAYKDGDINNCSLDNLYIKSRSYIPSLQKATAVKARKVVIKEGKNASVVYPSVRSAAKALYCSYQCLLDYLAGKRKKSVVKKRGRKIYYLEGND